MRRSSSTQTIASAGASSVRRTRYRGSRTAPQPRRDRPAAGLADRVLLRGKGHRRQGVHTAALAGALDLIAGLGGGRVEGYPEDAGSVPAGFLYHGALSTYEKLGFARDRKIGKHRWVVTKMVKPRHRRLRRTTRSPREGTQASDRLVRHHLDFKAAGSPVPGVSVGGHAMSGVDAVYNHLRPAQCGCDLLAEPHQRGACFYVAQRAEGERSGEVVASRITQDPRKLRAHGVRRPGDHPAVVDGAGEIVLARRRGDRRVAATRR